MAQATVRPATADLSVTKTVDDNAPNVGAQVVFTITVANAGPDVATKCLPGTMLWHPPAFVTQFWHPEEWFWRQFPFL